MNSIYSFESFQLGRGKGDHITRIDDFAAMIQICLHFLYEVHGQHIEWTYTSFQWLWFYLVLTLTEMRLLKASNWVNEIDSE